MCLKNMQAVKKIKRIYFPSVLIRTMDSIWNTDLLKLKRKKPGANRAFLGSQ
ncbi:hypothetical protein LEP1GSC169_0064 [Leptospira santarosai str. HAI1349]|nr:hypothetical protein LEP1GSC169_0064 [Leptospira santarosai str. HAI1349]